MPALDSCQEPFCTSASLLVRVRASIAAGVSPSALPPFWCYLTIHSSYARYLGPWNGLQHKRRKVRTESHGGSCPSPTREQPGKYEQRPLSAWLAEWNCWLEALLMALKTPRFNNVLTLVPGPRTFHESHSLQDQIKNCYACKLTSFFYSSYRLEVKCSSVFWAVWFYASRHKVTTDSTPSPSTRPH